MKSALIAHWIHGSHELKFSNTLVHSQMVCLRLVGTPNLKMLVLNYFLGPDTISAINIAEGK